jgi:hypothetical protein
LIFLNEEKFIASRIEAKAKVWFGHFSYSLQIILQIASYLLDMVEKLLKDDIRITNDLCYIIFLS